MAEKVDFRSYPLMIIGLLYLAAMAYQLGPELFMTLLGMTAFLMAMIIPGRFRSCDNAQPVRRTWFEG